VEERMDLHESATTRKLVSVCVDVALEMWV
jgi:hypothetical protein